MRASIRHSGSVNKDPRFTVQIVEVRRARIQVDLEVASLRFEATEAELRDLIRSARYALAESRVRKAFDDGKITFEEYERVLRELERSEPPDV